MEPQSRKIDPATVGRIMVLCSGIERRLRNRGGSGTGLHELTESCRDRLPPEAVKLLHYIASVRNKIAHEAENIAETEIDTEFFAEAVQAILQELGEELGEEPPAAEPEAAEEESVLPDWLRRTALIPGLHLLYPLALLLQAFDRAAGAGIGLALYALGGIMLAAGQATGEPMFRYFAVVWAAAGAIYTAVLGFLNRKEEVFPNWLCYFPGLNISYLLYLIICRCDRTRCFIALCLLAAAASGLLAIFAYREYLAGAIVLAAGYLAGLAGTRFLDQ